MPGVLMVEAMAQAGAVAVLSLPEYRGKLALFAGIDECRFRRTVLPGDTLRMEVTMEKLRGMFGRARAVASSVRPPGVRGSPPSPSMTRRTIFESLRAMSSRESSYMASPRCSPERILAHGRGARKAPVSP